MHTQTQHSAGACTRSIELPQHIEKKLFAPADMAAGMGFDWQATEALDAPCRVPSGGARAFLSTFGPSIVTGFVPCQGRT